MSVPSPLQNLEIDLVEEPTMFDSLARLVPDELQTAYFRVLSHTGSLRKLDSPLQTF